MFQVFVNICHWMLISYAFVIIVSTCFHSICMHICNKTTIALLTVCDGTVILYYIKICKVNFNWPGMFMFIGGTIKQSCSFYYEDVVWQAVRFKHKPCVAVLVEAKANPNSHDTNEESCLHYAARTDQLDILLLLFRGARPAVNAQNKVGL